MTEMMDIVDENDNVIRIATRKEIRQKNLLHRGVTIFVFNSKGEIFVHKRTENKDIYPGFYDLTCGGGVLAGENYDEAAKREIKEEIGIRNPNLKLLFDMRYKIDIDNFIAKIYSCVHDGKITIQKKEILEGYFLSIKKLKQLIKKKKFCPDSLAAFRVYEKIQKSKPKL